MSKSRASIFDNVDDVKELDLGGFVPRTAKDENAPAPQQVRAVTEAANFRSREPSAPKAEVKAKRAARRYRTGRNVQFNVKALQETVDAFYAVTEAKGWVLGYTLQRAIEALQRELKAQK
jgi:hypothetical protein